MHCRKATADVDRLLTKERVLYNSRYFYSKRLWVIVDDFFEYKIDAKSRKTVHTVVRGRFEVYLQVKGAWIKAPSDVHKSLVYFNHLWEDGVGVVDQRTLDSILNVLQDDEERATKAVQRGIRMGQAFSLATESEAVEAEEDHRALRDYEVL